MKWNIIEQLKKYELDRPASTLIDLNKQNMLSLEKQVANWHVQYDKCSKSIRTHLRMIDVFQLSGISGDIGTRRRWKVEIQNTNVFLLREGLEVNVAKC